MDWKKEVFTKAHYCARSVVTEFAKRFSLSLESAYCATPPEIAAFLSGDKKLDALARESLESRTRFCVLHGKGLEARVLEGDADFEEHEVHGIEGLSEHPESHEEEAHGYPAGH
jgi:hypothetical protein